MAATIVGKLRNPAGALTELYVDLDGPSSYVADGQSLTAQDLGLRWIYHASAGGSDNGDQFCAVGHASKGPVTSVKVAWFVMSTGAEVANGVDLSGRFTRVRVVGY